MNELEKVTGKLVCVLKTYLKKALFIICYSMICIFHISIFFCLLRVNYNFIHEKYLNNFLILF